MFQSIFIEKEVQNHPRVALICDRFPHLTKILCDHYKEVFNPSAQNFRLQKQKPSLIIAKKHRNFVLATPAGYGIGTDHNYYFSHMLNCIYDCRYCFLQGMYPSANFVLFINYEDFIQAIIEKIELHKDKTITFFSGYDCDSLALEPITRFVETILPLFSQYPKAYLELRTKSTQTACLLKTKAIANCIVSLTLSPQEVIQRLEHKTPSLKMRLQALKKLQKQGWPIGLRFDPLIYSDDFEKIYCSFFTQVFKEIEPKNIHSVTLGLFRLPKPFFKKMVKLYPEEKLFAHPIDESEQVVSYEKNRAEKLRLFCLQTLQNYIPSKLIFHCET